MLAALCTEVESSGIFSSVQLIEICQLSVFILPHDRVMLVRAFYLTSLFKCLIGLGDSNYSSYCKCPHMVNDRLQELGACQLLTPAFADDAVG